MYMRWMPTTTVSATVSSTANQFAGFTGGGAGGGAISYGVIAADGTDMEALRERILEVGDGADGEVTVGSSGGFAGGDIEIEVQDKDIRIDTYRSSGAGGQHVNKTDSAVRITHFPTNIVVTSSLKSQHQNRDIAMQALKSRLYQLELDRRSAAVLEAHENKGDAGWGNQIRSYVLQPYQMVKDLRTGVQTSDTSGVLDGDLDEFMAATLAQRAFGTAPASVEDVD